MRQAELFTFTLGMEVAVTDVATLETAIAEAVVASKAGNTRF